jgi:hypothetical protein
VELIACSLSDDERGTRRERWQRLDVVERVLTDDGLRLVFRREPGVEAELEALAAAERECCAFATWSVSAGEGDVVLEVGATGEGIAAVHAMFTTPRPRMHLPAVKDR